MNTGKTLFAQIMDFLPWKTFHRIVAWHGGDKGVRSLSCAGQFRTMAFAQLSYRESLRDIEACLLAQAAKLYHMGSRTGCPFDAGRCQRVAQRAHLGMLCRAADYLRLRTVLPRRLGTRPEQHRLCPGLDHHRPVLVRFPLGALSHHQSRREDAHLA